MKHHSSTFAIQQRTGLDERTIERFLRWRDERRTYGAYPQPERYWWKLTEEEIQEAAEMLAWAVAACPSKPLSFIKREGTLFSAIFA